MYFYKIISELLCQVTPTQQNSNFVELKDVPFDIPNNWKWVKLSDVATIVRGLTFSTSFKEQKEDTILVLRGGNINSKTETLEYLDNIYVDKSIPNTTQYLKVGDTLIVASSGTKSSVGKSTYIEEIPDKTSFGGFMMVVRPFDCIISKYISYHIKMYRQKIINDTVGYISNITNSILGDLLIPLPPIEEQQRIIDKLEIILTLIKDI